MSGTQPHVGDYWTRKADGTRIQITKVWLNPEILGVGVAYDIHDGRPGTSSRAMGLDLFLKLYAPEQVPCLTEDDVRRIVREELAAAGHGITARDLALTRLPGKDV